MSLVFPLGSVALGTMRLTSWGANMTPQDAASLILAAHASGVRVIDSADIYGHYTVERLLGEALRLLPPEVRGSLFLVSKFGIHLPCEARPGIARKAYESSEAHAVASVSRTREELGVPSVDLVLVHRPDPLTSPADLAATLAGLVRGGLARGVGVSNYTGPQLRALHAHTSRAGVPLVANQVKLSLLHPEALFDGTVDACLELGVAVMAYSPLGGLFDGEAGSDGDDAARRARVLAALARVASQKGATREAVALAWIMAHPARIVPVIGTTRQERVKGLVEGARGVEISRWEWFELLEAVRGKEID
jgi:predicted oxidoreductase